MRAEISEPLERERSAEKEDLPAVEGCGHRDPNFDPVAVWEARQAAKPAQATESRSLMPGVEAMPNWRGFVGWLEPSEEIPAALPAAPAEVAAPEAKAPIATPASKPSLVADEITFDAPVDEPTSITLADFDEPSHQAAQPVMDLGNLEMESIIQAAAEAVEEVPVPEAPAEASHEPETKQATMVVMLDEPSASLSAEPEPELKLELEPVVASSAPALVSEVQSTAPAGAGLSPRLAGVRPLAHPGRLPRGFELSAGEKGVLRKCNGQQTTQSILDAGIELDGATLTAFLKRCAKVKLVTFKK